MNSQPGGPGALGQITKKEKQLPCDDGPCTPVLLSITLGLQCSGGHTLVFERWMRPQKHILEYRLKQAA